MTSGINRRDFLKASARAGLLLGFGSGKRIGSLSTTSYDIVIRNGTIVDGLEQQAFPGGPRDRGRPDPGDRSPLDGRSPDGPGRLGKDRRARDSSTSMPTPTPGSSCSIPRGRARSGRG